MRNWLSLRWRDVVMSLESSPSCNRPCLKLGWDECYGSLFLAGPVRDAMRKNGHKVCLTFTSVPCHNKKIVR